MSREQIPDRALERVDSGRYRTADARVGGGVPLRGRSLRAGQRVQTGGRLLALRRPRLYALADVGGLLGLNWRIRRYRLRRTSYGSYSSWHFLFPFFLLG